MKIEQLMIHVENLSDWRSEKRVEYASFVYGANRLQLLATLYGGLEVVLNDEIRHVNMQPFAATENYNSILEVLLGNDHNAITELLKPLQAL